MSDDSYNQQYMNLIMEYCPYYLKSWNNQQSKLGVNLSSALVAELHVDLLSDQLSVLANLQIVLIIYQNIRKIPYPCITICFIRHATNIT